MATKNDWWDVSWNPVTGCTPCSPGCKNCWAKAMMARFRPNRDFSKIAMYPEKLEQPLRWRKPRRIFVCSMGDLFHKDVPFEFIERVFDIMLDCPQHTFLILTKRVKRMEEWRRHASAYNYSVSLSYHTGDHICLGLSISTQKEADEKIPILLQIPAAVRFLCIEPMLERIDLIGKDKSRMGKTGYLANYFMPFFCNNCGRHISRPPSCVISTCGYCGGGKGYRQEESIHWVIIGAESLGKSAGRFCKLEWIRDVVRQCKAAGVPVYVKQIHLNGKLIKDFDQFPKEVRFREYPKGLTDGKNN